MTKFKLTVLASAICFVLALYYQITNQGRVNGWWIATLVLMLGWSSIGWWESRKNMDSNKRKVKDKAFRTVIYILTFLIIVVTIRMIW